MKCIKSFVIIFIAVLVFSRFPLTVSRAYAGIVGSQTWFEDNERLTIDQARANANSAQQNQPANTQTPAASQAPDSSQATYADQGPDSSQATYEDQGPDSSQPTYADQGPDETDVPPPLQMATPPDLVVVPSVQYPDQYVYMVPGMVGVYLYQGVWYRNYNGIWYYARVYNDVWTPVATGIVPPVIVSVPVDYTLFLPPYYPRIHYGFYLRHWRAWQWGRHWHNYGWYRNEMRPDIRRERMREHLERERRFPSRRLLGNERLQPGRRDWQRQSGRAWGQPQRQWGGQRQMGRQYRQQPQRQWGRQRQMGQQSRRRGQPLQRQAQGGSGHQQLRGGPQSQGLKSGPGFQPFKSGPGFQAPTGRSTKNGLGW